MQVRARFAHYSTDGALHAAGDVYTLEGVELEIRLKDAIVIDAAAPDPAPETAAIDAALNSAPAAGE